MSDAEQNDDNNESEEMMTRALTLRICHECKCVHMEVIVTIRGESFVSPIEDFDADACESMAAALNDAVQELRGLRPQSTETKQ